MEEHVKGNGVPCLTMGDREQEEKILQPVAHTLQIPGKQHLVKLASAYNYWLKVPADKLTVVKDIEHAFHYSLLLIDDIEDNSVLRRGIPVAHSIYGVPSTTNASIYLMLKGVKRALSLNHPDAIALCIEQLLDMYYGQGLEIYWRENNTCPSFEEYKQLIQRKLASLLFRVRLMQLVSDNKTDFTKLNRIMQLYWQIRDDYCNLCMQQYTNERGYCDDISEGKFSFPIIHAILNNPDDQQVISILRFQNTSLADPKRL
uniref:Geranylgeranyl diphosphate synthase-1-A-isoform n=1 Tax=Nasutitermes takasagoensis TaxID=62960 RepID=A1IIV8_9NEOP|nr:geranylgeranyl diphosphate synthase-1-A-isoform [Nasutitermes takasagoensis]BAF42690.1 geranylgeranyl diphosphate synthase-1-A-isoform [Nasutitermes takasagoensis]